jgi:hypothetical protein
VVEFKTAAGEALAISVPSSEVAVLKHFQARMPYGLVVPRRRDPMSTRVLQTGPLGASACQRPKFMETERLEV